MTGYSHKNYAASLSEFGSPRFLPRCSGWILERLIPGTLHRDAMGSYPLFTCRDWSRLSNDLEKLTEELVSVVLVTDPFGDYTEESLRHTFKDLVSPFKEHFIVDLAAIPETFVHPHHRRNARKALEVIYVERCSAADSISEWISLYANLVDRHDIRGIARFSDSSFAMQSKVPGAIMLRASRRRNRGNDMVVCLRRGRLLSSRRLQRDRLRIARIIRAFLAGDRASQSKWSALA